MNIIVSFSPGFPAPRRHRRRRGRRHGRRSSRRQAPRTPVPQDAPPEDPPLEWLLGDPAALPLVDDAMDPALGVPMAPDWCPVHGYGPCPRRTAPWDFPIPTPTPAYDIDAAGAWLASIPDPMHSRDVGAWLAAIEVGPPVALFGMPLGAPPMTPSVPTADAAPFRVSTPANSSPESAGSNRPLLYSPIRWP